MTPKGYDVTDFRLSIRWSTERQNFTVEVAFVNGDNYYDLVADEPIHPGQIAELLRELRKHIHTDELFTIARDLPLDVKALRDAQRVRLEKKKAEIEAQLERLSG